MGQRNEVKPAVLAFDAEHFANHLCEFRTIDKLGDGQSAGRNDETGLQNLNFVIHPRRAVSNFVR